MFFFKKMRRRQLRKKPFPADWIHLLKRNVPFYSHLPDADRQELHGHMQVFLAEKYFEGCAGVAVTEEMKVTIAAQACRLLLHRETDYFPRLVSILIYPTAYLAQHRERNSAGLVTEGIQQRQGESWSHGTVVLSWDDVRAGAADAQDGHNVVYHEFAHQLDIEDGQLADGSVTLPRGSLYSAWTRIFSREYRALKKDLAAGRKTVLDSYAATSPAEFFAVATECFFEIPVALKERHPELYAELKLYYKQDPAARRQEEVP
jgi:hypothetical protein